MNEKLEEALKLIRKECQKHEYCTECPMRTYEEYNCTLEIAPSKWTFASEHEEFPRIFR